MFWIGWGWDSIGAQKVLKLLVLVFEWKMLGPNMQGQHILVLGSIRTVDTLELRLHAANIVDVPLQIINPGKFVAAFWTGQSRHVAAISKTHAP